MDVIRITYPANALTDKQKEKLATLLIDAVMRQEVDPMTEWATSATFLVYNEIPRQNYFMSREPFWLVQGMCTVPASQC
jgi:phenylpyruvate tautomerase PptA (4-oxalocrotonate tautomerase family)